MSTDMVKTSNNQLNQEQDGVRGEIGIKMFVVRLEFDLRLNDLI